MWVASKPRWGMHPACSCSCPRATAVHSSLLCLQVSSLCAYYVRTTTCCTGTIATETALYIFTYKREHAPTPPLSHCSCQANPSPPGDSYVSLPTSSGNLRVSVADWIDLAAAAAPDAVVMLSDEISSVATGGSSRTRKSIDRSSQWFVQQLAELRARPSLHSTAVFAAVQGGNSSTNRARACSSIAGMKVDGVVVGGLNTGEERDERCSIIKATICALPAHLPRMLSSIGGPEDMLDAGASPPLNHSTKCTTHPYNFAAHNPY
jgi:hypothetical protein